MLRFSLLLVATCVQARGSAHYGPHKCVALSRSSQGSCVMTPNCKKESMADFQFSFVCESKEGEVEHVFGEEGDSGFENGVAFDSGVKCQKCLAPQKPRAALQKLQTKNTTNATEAPATNATATTEGVPLGTEGTAPEDAAFFGPAGCVGTYRSPAGTCVVQTRCKPASIKDYNFGLTCVDAEGASVRHLFGVSSFDPVETFDTLIGCNLCLGLSGDSLMDKEALTNQVAHLKSDMHEMKEAVEGIKSHLGIGAAAASTAAPTAAAKSDAAADAGFLHTTTKQHKKKPHHSHKKAKVQRLAESEDLDLD